MLLNRPSKQYLVMLFLEILKTFFFVLVTCLLWASCLHVAFLLLAEAHVVVSQVTACSFLVLCSSSAFLFSQLWQLLSPLLPGFLCSQLSSLHRCMVAPCLEPRDPSAFYCSNGTLMLLCLLFVGLQGKKKRDAASCPEKLRWVIDSESSLHSRGLAR